MKKLLSVLLLLCLCMPVALAGLSDDPNHFAESVVDGTYESVYPEFYNAASPSIIIPGLSMDFIPQGIAYYEPGNLMFLTGYSSFGFFNSMLLRWSRKSCCACRTASPIPAMRAVCA